MVLLRYFGGSGVFVTIYKDINFCVRTQHIFRFFVLMVLPVWVVNISLITFVCCNLGHMCMFVNCVFL